jgi:hypothetical protein
MAFLDSNSILVLEKEGSVRLVSNGTLEQEPVLNVNVQTESERGLLGIDVLDMKNVFLGSSRKFELVNLEASVF